MKLSDNAALELIGASRAGDGAAEERLLQELRPLVKAKSRDYFLRGADSDDLIQEGMIGLFNAVKSFDPDKSDSFLSYASLCIDRRLADAVRTANRGKHRALDNYYSLSLEYEEGGGMDLPARELDPEQALLSSEGIEDLERKIIALSEFDRSVLNMFLDGASYAQIAKAQSKEIKAVDNALQRIKKRLKG